jgi:chromosomal replication initiation ATPase DnaA
MKLTEEEYQSLCERIVTAIKRDYFLVEKKAAPLHIDKVGFLEHIIDFVSDHYDISRQDLRSGRNYRHLIESRRMYSYLAKKYTKKISYATIGQFIKRDHATIIHSEKSLKEESSVNKKYRQEVETAESEFTSKYMQEIINITNPINE